VKIPRLYLCASDMTVNLKLKYDLDYTKNISGAAFCELVAPASHRQTYPGNDHQSSGGA
jgi:hypothetical protein